MIYAGNCKTFGCRPDVGKKDSVHHGRDQADEHCHGHREPEIGLRAFHLGTDFHQGRDVPGPPDERMEEQSFAQVVTLGQARQQVGPPTELLAEAGIKCQQETGQETAQYGPAEIPVGQGCASRATVFEQDRRAAKMNSARPKTAR